MFITVDEATGLLKFTGASKAKVISNDDPQARGRIVVDHPMLGETTWIPYLQLPWSFTMPEPDDLVFVSCEAGSEHHAYAWGSAIAGDDGNLDTLPDAFQRTSPTNRGFYTPGGHLIEYDDGDGLTKDGQGIRITTSGGNIISILEDTTAEQGLITLETAGGAKLTIDGTNDAINGEVAFGDTFELSADNGFQTDTPAAGGTHISQKSGKLDLTGNVQITATDGNGNSLTLDATGIAATDGNGNEIAMTAAGVDITDANGNEIAMTASGVKVTDSAGGELNISGGLVALGNPTAELVDLVNQTLTKLITVCTDLSTTTAPGFGAPISSVAAFATLITDFTAIQTKVLAIKGSL